MQTHERGELAGQVLAFGLAASGSRFLPLAVVLLFFRSIDSARAARRRAIEAAPYCSARRRARNSGDQLTTAPSCVRLANEPTTLSSAGRPSDWLAALAQRLIMQMAAAELALFFFFFASYITRSGSLLAGQRLN